MPKRFKVLRVVGTLFKLIGCMWLALGTLAAVFFVGVPVYGRFGGGPTILYWTGPLGLPPSGVAFLIQNGALAILVGLLAFSLAVWPFMMLYAAGDVLYVLISIEQSTRTTAEWMQSRTASRSPAAAPAPAHASPTPAPPLVPATGAAPALAAPPLLQAGVPANGEGGGHADWWPDL